MNWLDKILADEVAANTWATRMGTASGVMGAVGTAISGIEAQRAAHFAAMQMMHEAGQSIAASQRDAAQIDKQAQYAESAALAAAAASGGGASDPTVVNLIARNAQEFAYRKAVALYQGDERARSLEMSAAAREYEGKSAKFNSLLSAGGQMMQAGTTLARGAAREKTLFQRFGRGAPDGSDGGLDRPFQLPSGG